MGLLSARQRMGAAALILAASTIVSRLMGLVRDKVISWQFGAGGEADMYFAAFVVPDIINYMLAGGFMSITIIPLLSRRFQEDEEDAWKFFSCVFCWMGTASLALTVVGVLAAEPLARLIAPGFTPEQWLRLARSQLAMVQALMQTESELRQKLEDRRLIEQAKGRLMRHQGLDEDEAYRLMRSTAMSRHLSLGELARQLLQALPA